MSIKKNVRSSIKNIRSANNQYGNYLLNQKPSARLVAGIACSVGACLFSLFIVRGMQGKVCAAIVTPLLLFYSVYAYIKEKKDDKEYLKKDSEYREGNIYRSVEWGEDYTEYRMNAGFEQLKASSMKAELIRRFHDRESLELGLILLSVSCGAVCSIPLYSAYSITKKIILVISGLITFWIACSVLAEYAGIPVFRFYRENKHTIDFTKLNARFMQGKMLSYKKNGINLCYDYVVYYTNRKVGVIDMEAIESVSRKVVRVKKFQDSLYAGDEYRYYVSIDAKRLGKTDVCHVEIELSDIQVQMVLDEIKRQGFSSVGSTARLAVAADNEIVT